MTEEQKQYNLEERTARFGETVIVFCRELKHDIILNPLVSQIVRSATSVGANYMERGPRIDVDIWENRFNIER